MITPESLRRIQAIFLEELQKDNEDTADSDRFITSEVEYYHRHGSTVWLENREVGALWPAMQEQGLRRGIIAAHRVDCNLCHLQKNSMNQRNNRLKSLNGQSLIDSNVSSKYASIL